MQETVVTGLSLEKSDQRATGTLKEMEKHLKAHHGLYRENEVQSVTTSLVINLFPGQEQLRQSVEETLKLIKAVFFFFS